jgi:hypothetical protein
MKKIINIVLSILMITSVMIVIPSPDTKAVVPGTLEITIDPAVCGEEAEFELKFDQAADFDGFNITFLDGSILPAASTYTYSYGYITVGVWDSDVYPTEYYYPQSVSSVTPVGNVLQVRLNNTYTVNGAADSVKITINKSYGIKLPPCPNCGPMNIQVDSINPTTGVPENPDIASYELMGKVTQIKVLSDPNTTSSTYYYGYGSTSANTKFGVLFRRDACGELNANEYIQIKFPSTYGGYTSFPDGTLDSTKVRVWHDSLAPVFQDTVSHIDGPTYWAGVNQAPVLAVEADSTNRTMTVYLDTAVAPDMPIPASSWVSVIFDKEIGLVQPTTSGYKTVEVSTTEESYPATSPDYMVANQATVTARSNAANAQDVEYSIEWSLPTGITLSGDAGDWIEIQFQDLENVNWPLSSNTPFSPGLGNYPPTVGFSNSTYSYYYDDIEYGSVVSPTAPTSTLRVQLPLGYEISAGTSFTMTIKHPTLDNTATPGRYRIMLRHNKDTSNTWSYSNYFAIVDGVSFNSGSVIVEPPTVYREAQYTIYFEIGQELRPGDEINVFFPTETSFTNYQSIPAGSVWLVWDTVAPSFGASDCRMNYNAATWVEGEPRHLELNAPIESSYGEEGDKVTITLPGSPGDYVIGDGGPPPDTFVGIRFCLNSGIKNPNEAGAYNLEISTTTQPERSLSSPYNISTAITNVEMKPTPNATCSTNVQYQLTFKTGGNGGLDGSAGDYIDIDFQDLLKNPQPDFASILNTFQSTEAVTEVDCYSSPPFTSSMAYWTISFMPGQAVNNTIDIKFPPNVTMPSTIPTTECFIFSGAQIPNMFDNDVVGPGIVNPTTITMVDSHRIRLALPAAIPAGDDVYIRFSRSAGIINPSAPGSAYTVNISTDSQPYLTPGFFGITEDFLPSYGAQIPTADMEWRTDVNPTPATDVFCPTPIPNYAGASAQYLFTVRTSGTCTFNNATVDIKFPEGTYIPSSIDPSYIQIRTQADTDFGFALDTTCSTGTSTPASITIDQINRTISFPLPAGFNATQNAHILICRDAGIRNPTTVSVSNQLGVTVTGTAGCSGGELTVQATSERYAITPSPIGGIIPPLHTITIGGGYYYYGYSSNHPSSIQPIGPQALRLYLPAGLKINPSQSIDVTITGAAGLVNTCQEGAYIVKVRTSKEPSWVDSEPYSIVDTVQFSCGIYPDVNPPSTSSEAQYDISFTVGQSSGLEANIGTITVAFPSGTTIGGYSSVPAGSIYVSTLPITGGCPPDPPAQPVILPPSVSGSAITFTTPIHIGNSQTVYVRFCKSAGIKNPYQAGSYTLQVKTSKQPNYGVSCNYAIGTAISDVNVEPIPASACNQNTQYKITFKQGSSGGIKGSNGDYIDINFYHPDNPGADQASISNIFTAVNVPSPSTVMVTPYGYSYSYMSSSASAVEWVDTDEGKKLRIYVPADFTSNASGQVTVIFETGAGLDNTCSPGQYKVRVSTSLEQEEVDSDPYSIEDAPRNITVDVQPSTVSKEAEYTIRFRVGPNGGLTANSDTISIAFPTGTTLPYNSISAGSIWIAEATDFTSTGCPPVPFGGGTAYQVELPPDVTSQTITFTTPTNIANNADVVIRFCLNAGIKNPYTADAYRLQVKTSKQSAYGISEPYAITSAISDVVVTPNPNTVGVCDVEYTVEFKNGNSSLNGDLGDYVDIQFKDKDKNPAPDYASISTDFTQGNSISDLYVQPLTQPMIQGVGVDGSSRWDISFGIDSSSGLSVGDEIYVQFPSGCTDAGGGNNLRINTQQWDDYSFHPGQSTYTPGTPTQYPCTLSGSLLTITITNPIPAGSDVYIRIPRGEIDNPSVLLGNAFLTVSTNKQPTPVISNYIAFSENQTFDILSAPIDTNYGNPTPPGYGGPFSPKVYPTTAGEYSQINLSFLIRPQHHLQPISGTRPTISVTFPPEFNLPNTINTEDIWVSCGNSLSDQPFLNNCVFNKDPICQGVQGTDYDHIDVIPTISGNTITFEVPSFFDTNPNVFAGDCVHVQFRRTANIKNPSSSGVFPFYITTSGNNTLGSNYGKPVRTENISITPAENPLGPLSIPTSSITLNSGYGTTGSTHPSKVVALGDKYLRIYLPLGFTFNANGTAKIKFEKSAGLCNTNTPGSYIAKVRTSKEPTWIESAPYSIIAAVTGINVEVVPPIINMPANYTIDFEDTSSGGLVKDIGTITIAFPTETVVPMSIPAGTVYVAKNVNFDNSICPPTHTGILGTDYAPLSAPSVVSGDQVTITTPIDINAGDHIYIRFCESANIKNPPNPKYYTLQLMTSAQPDFVVSNPYAIKSGLSMPKVEVVPNTVSRASSTAVLAVDAPPGTNPIQLENVSGWLVGDLILIGDVLHPFSPVNSHFTRVTAVNTITNELTLQTPIPVGTNFLAGDNVYLSRTGITDTSTGASTANSIPVNNSSLFEITEYVAVGNIGTQPDLSVVVSHLAANTLGLSPNITAGLPVGTRVELVRFEQPAGGCTGDVYAETTIKFKLGTSGSLLAGRDKIYVALEYGPSTNDRGYNMTGNSISSGSVMVNDVVCSIAPTIGYTPVGGKYEPQPTPTFGDDYVTLEITVPEDLNAGTEVVVTILPNSGIPNPYVAGSYTVAVWTSVEQSANESRAYEIVDGVVFGEVGVTVTPPSTSENASYIVDFYTCEPLTENVDDITITFPDDTTVPEGIMPNHIFIDNDPVFDGTAADATPHEQALAPIIVSGRSITFTTSKSFSGNDNHVYIKFTYEAGLINPTTAGSYKLKVRTSKQPKDVNSPYYEIRDTSTKAEVIPNPATANRPNVEYTIKFVLSGAGNLTKDISWIKMQFPDNDIFGAGGGYSTVEALLPASISPDNITVNGKSLTVLPTVDTVDRTIKLIVPETIDAGTEITVVILSGAGLTNPVVGSYRMGIQTSVEPVYIDTEIYSIKSALGGTGGTLSPEVCLSYDYSLLVNDVNNGDSVFDVDSILGWTQFDVALLGDFVSSNMDNVFMARVEGIDTVAGPPPDLSFTYTTARRFPLGTPIFRMKEYPNITVIDTNPCNIGDTTVDVTDASSFTPGDMISIGSGAGADIVRVESVNVSVTPHQIGFLPPAQGAHPVGAEIALIPCNVGLVNAEAYYMIHFITGGTGNLNQAVSTITLIFPHDTYVPDSIIPSSISVSPDGIDFTNCSDVEVDSDNRKIVLTVPTSIPANNDVYVRITSKSGIRNPSVPGSTYRMQIATSSEPDFVDSRSYEIEGAGAPTVTVNPCTAGAVGAVHTIEFNITNSIPQGQTITITFPTDYVMPSVVRQENVKINGTQVSGPIPPPENNKVEITAPKDLPSSSKVVVEFLESFKLKNPPTPGHYRLKVRTSIEPDNLDVESNNYYICPEVKLAGITLIPSSLSLGVNQTGQVQAQAKDENGDNINYNVSYSWQTDIGMLSGLTGDGVTLTAPASAGSGVITCTADYNDEKMNAVCSVTVTPPLGSVSIYPSGSKTLSTNSSQTFRATALDTSGNEMSGVNYSWSISGGIGSLSTVNGNTTTLSTGSSPTTGTIACQAEYGGDVKSSSVTVSVISGQVDPDPGDPGTEPTSIIQGTVSPQSHNIDNDLSVLTFQISSLDDLSGGEIRLTFPAGWSPPNGANTKVIAPSGVSLGTVTYNSSVLVIPVVTMTKAKTITVNYMDPTYPRSEGVYKFTLQAKKQNGSYEQASPHPTVELLESSTPPQNVSGTGRCVVEPSTASSGSTGVKFKFIFTATADISNGEVQIKIPLDWTAPTTSPGAKGYIKISNMTGEVIDLHVIPGGYIALMLGDFLKNHTFTLEYNNVTLPMEEKTYTFNVMTVGKVGELKNIPNPPKVTLAKTKVTNVTCIPTPNSAGAEAQYQITFRTSDAGVLTKDQSSITIGFPSDTTVPATIQPSTVSVMGVPLIAPPDVNVNTRDVKLTVPTDVPPNTTVSVKFDIESGILNPTSPKNNYKITAHTSSDASAVPSSNYAIEASTISIPEVTPDPVVTSAEAQYTIKFKVGGSGALKLGSGQIIMRFPNDTFIPTNILATKITVNGKAITKRPEIDTVARKIAIYVPSPVQAGEEVVVIFDKEAGLKNPTQSGNYTAWVSTTQETIEVESDSYGIGESTVTNVMVESSSLDASDTCVDYEISFRTGSFGALTSSSTITIWFHPNYKVGSISKERVTVNGATTKSTPKVRQNQYIDIEVPQSLNAGSEVTVKIQCLNNPTTPGQYECKVSTSSEPTLIQSNTFKIGESMSTNMTISPANPDGDNGWYKSNPSLMFDCNVSTATTYYSLDGDNRKVWAGVPIRLDDGIHMVQYWSEASGFNSEAKQTVSNIKVDTTKPILNITTPKNGITVGAAKLDLAGTYDEENILEINVGINGATSKTRMTFDEGSRTWQGSTMLIRGTNRLDIKAIDEAGNESFSPIVTVIYEPGAGDETYDMIIVNPKDNQEPPGGVSLVNESEVGYHHLEMDVNFIVSAEGANPTIEVSSELEPDKWTELDYDSAQKKATGDVTFRAKAGDNKVSIRIKDADGKVVKTINRIVVCKVTVEFYPIKSADTSSGGTVNEPDNMTFNDKTITNMDAYPYIETSEGRTYVPFRFLGNAFGAEVGWDANTRTASYEFEGTRVELVLGSNQATIIKDGKSTTIPLDENDPNVKTKIVDGRLHVPLRFVSEALGWNVAYEGGSVRKVTVSYP